MKNSTAYKGCQYFCYVPMCLGLKVMHVFGLTLNMNQDERSTLSHTLQPWMLSVRRSGQFVPMLCSASLFTCMERCSKVTTRNELRPSSYLCAIAQQETLYLSMTTTNQSNDSFRRYCAIGEIDVL